jgi:polar amino acid transport system substrate-binding protein
LSTACYETLFPSLRLTAKEQLEWWNFMTQLRLLVLTLLTLASLALPGATQQTTQPSQQTTIPTQPPALLPKTVVVTRVLPPFVIEDGENYIGFSAELWQELAKRTSIDFTWKRAGNVKEILAAIDSSEAQIGIAAVSITAAREQLYDFSQPMFESGLQIMVPNVDAGFSWRDLLDFMTRGAMPYLMAILGLLILIPGHLAWFAERRHAEPIFTKHYFPGIFQAMAWALGAAAGQQGDAPRSPYGKILSAAAVFASLLFLTYWQAELTSSFTVQQLQGGINGPEDLPGKLVGTTTGSTSATYLQAHGSKVQPFEKITDAFVALENGRLEAVVFDAPVLNYYATTSGRGKVRVVGTMFKRENYGIVFPRGSELRKKINQALLKMREDGSYSDLCLRWFGTSGNCS